MTAHKHAALMLQYAQDAAETKIPWKRWEYKKDGRNDEWLPVLNAHPDWNVNFEYRRKSQVIKVGKWEFPKPTNVTPEKGTRYWVVVVLLDGYVPYDYIWMDEEEDFALLGHNMIHLSREAAQAQANAFNAICRGDID